ncbi:helix-turn-helix domain-containing protein [Halorussus aquaticus]|uniref:Helix-turn-helix domain-containing protein n=1 Tax=Halorussus aquaticus TaxID=2953748 RepID=A0ABD5Q9E0_9EURY|nr:helix-turn-helix domain-containing protein [Halorussus aquaticus]
MGTTDKEREVHKCQHCGNVSFGRSGSDSDEEERPSAVELPELAVVLREVFGISETGIRICVFLMEDGESTAGELADHLELDRSTVSRQLNHLTDIGLLEKRQRLLSEGGYVHVYTPVDVEEVRQRLTVGLHAWMDEALELVEDINREKVAALARANPDDSESTDIYWDR